MKVHWGNHCVCKPTLCQLVPVAKTKAKTFIVLHGMIIRLKSNKNSVCFGLRLKISRHVIFQVGLILNRILALRSHVYVLIYLVLCNLWNVCFASICSSHHFKSYYSTQLFES